MYMFFVGVDVSKAWIDVSCSEGLAVHYAGQFNNSMAGFKRMIAQLKKSTMVDLFDWFVCFENTGTYSKLLLQWLCSQGIACREEDPSILAKLPGIRRGKSDKMDAGFICQYAYEKREKIKPTLLTPPAITELKKLLSRRNLHIRQCAALKTSLKEHRAEFGAELLKQLDQQNDLLILKHQECISFIENRIEELILSDDEMQKNSTLSQSVIGVGPVITWYMIATTGNFKNFETSRRFSSYGGMAPFPRGSSGIKKGRNRVSPKANKQIKALLSNGALSAIHHDPEIRKYYKRRIAEGKKEGVVLNNVKNKLVARVFAAVHRGTPFVKLSSYA
jgi:transposase